MRLPCRDSRQSIEDCNTFKYKVQNWIKAGKLKIGESNGPAGVEGQSRTKVEVTRQEREAPMEANSGKATMPRDKVLVAKTGRNETGCPSTVEGSKERPHEHNGEEEKKVLQDLDQDIERMFVK